MLKTLLIRDYALIEELEVHFGSGLNVITGETGAGKSILVGAMKMMLGERASTDVIRSGSTKAVIEGIFDYDSPAVTRLLEEAEIEPGPVLILRREITASYSRGFINDSPANLGLMRAVAEQVIDLHGQHEHQSLLRPETHLELLDQYGGLGGLLVQYQKHFRDVEELYTKRADLTAKENQLAAQKELIEFQIQEIDRVNPLPEEEAELEAENRVLENAEYLFEATGRLYEALYNAEDAVYDRLVVARNELRDLAKIDQQFEEALGEIKSAEIIVSEVTSFLQEYNASIPFDPDRLEEVRERLGELTFLARKYGGSIEGVLERRKEIGQLHELASDFSGAIARLNESIQAEQAQLSDAAWRLSTKRKEVATKLESAIEAELKHLGMASASFSVRFTVNQDPDGWVRVETEGGAFTNVDARTDGIDTVAFYISANVGEDEKPLVKIASGGEISRIMLALKSILAKSERLPILVFDEIDVGISGRIAEKVGDSLRRLGLYHQIISITHLPQIAAKGETHFRVQKSEVDGRTRTEMVPLEADDRIREVASLISGAEVSDAAVKAARQLMESDGS